MPEGGVVELDGGGGRGDASDGGAAGAPDSRDESDRGSIGSPDVAASDDGAAGASDAGGGSDGGAGGAPDAGDPSNGAAGVTGDAGATAGASGMTGGTAGGGGVGGSAGTSGGAGGTGGAGGMGGAAGTDADAGAGGAACGDVGQPCCGSNACDGDLACLGGTTCSCVGALDAHYVVRTDGQALLELNDTSKTQRPVLDGTTGAPLGDVASIHEGYAHACALLGAAQTVWCWRTDAAGNTFGQLGSGATDTNGAVFGATQVLAAPGRPLTNVTAIARSYTPYYNEVHQVNTSCAVTGDGHLYCWGDLKYLAANLTATSAPFAVPVTSNGSTPLTGVLAVSVSSDFACALRQGAANKEVWCWGANGTTEVLAQGDMDYHPYPLKVPGLTNPSKVVTGDSTACALDGGAVRCWGYNAHGEAGVGTLKTPVPSPTPVILMGSATPLANLSDLSAGNDAHGLTSFCGLDDTAKKLFCWGAGYHTSASAYAVPDVVAVGAVDQNSTNGPSLVRALTSDGLYRVGAVTRQPNCGAPQ